MAATTATRPAPAPTRTTAVRGCERCGPGNHREGQSTREKYTLNIRPAWTVTFPPSEEQPNGWSFDFCDSHKVRYEAGLAAAGADIQPFTDSPVPF